MRKHFAQVWWGLLLFFIVSVSVLIDAFASFHINDFTVICEGFGYAIAAIGCGGLSVLSPRFSIAQKLLFAMAGFWLTGFAVNGGVLFLVISAFVIANCMMIWQLLGGIREFALGQNRDDLAQRAETRRILYCRLLVGAWLFGLAAIASDGAPPLAIFFRLLAILLVVLCLVMLLMILHLIHRVKGELVT